MCKNQINNYLKPERVTIKNKVEDGNHLLHKTLISFVMQNMHVP